MLADDIFPGSSSDRFRILASTGGTFQIKEGICKLQYGVLKGKVLQNRAVELRLKIVEIVLKPESRLEMHIPQSINLAVWANAVATISYMAIALWT